ncbi:MAG: MiaB/RimO family radical SAM methylthiotransferase, partial [Calditrichota bacterium]
MKKAQFYTLGCKLNRAETAQVSGLWLFEGWAQPITTGEAPDVVFINTCAVTEKAAAKSRHAINRLIREHPQATIVAAGCLAQHNPQETARLPGVHFVIGTQDRFDADFRSLGGRVLTRPPRDCRLIVSSDFNKPLHLSFPVYGDHARPFVKIQDGCDQGCSYCIIPKLRGSNRSVPESEITDFIRQLAHAGAKEIVLTGVRIGSWGQDLPEKKNLAGLLSRLIDLPGIRRIRLGSLEPWELTDDIIQLFKDNVKICPHLHLPLQHIHSAILERMGRPPLGDGLDRIYDLAEHNPDLAIGVDLIIGFPGESEAECSYLIERLRRLPLAYMHLFTFSRRPGVPAATFEPQTSPIQIKKRYAELRELDGLKRTQFYQSQAGKIREAIPDHWREGEPWTRAVTDNYLHLTIPTESVVPGQPV